MNFLNKILNKILNELLNELYLKIFFVICFLCQVKFIKNIFLKEFITGHFEKVSFKILF